MKEPGFYVVAASARRLRRSGQSVVAANLFLSDLVLVTRAVTASAGDPRLEVQLSRARPASRSRASRIAFRRSGTGADRANRREDDGRGGAGALRVSGKRGRGGVFLLARRGRDLALDRASSTRTAPRAAETRLRSSTPTGASTGPARSSSGRSSPTRRAQAGAVRGLPGRAGHGRLVDPNGEKVEPRTVTTNAFGTAAGEFVVPAGRLLGAWRLRELAPGGAPAIPGRGVQAADLRGDLQGPEEPLRLNRPGDADGRGALLLRPAGRERHVRWRVTREPVLVVVGLGVGLRPGAAHADGRDRRRPPRGRRHVQGRLHPGGRRAAGEGIEGPDLPLRRERRRRRRGRRDARRDALVAARLRLRRGARRLRAGLLARRGGAGLRRSCARASTARRAGEGHVAPRRARAARRPCSRPTSLPRSRRGAARTARTCAPEGGQYATPGTPCGRAGRPTTRRSGCSATLEGRRERSRAET